MSSKTPVRIFDVFSSGCCLAKSSSSTKEEVLREIASIAVKSGKVDASLENEVFNGLKEREDVGSTGFGNGIAIPHCRLDSVDRFVMGIVTAPQGIDFDSLDEEPVKLFVFIIGPRSENSAHVRLLSSISQALMIPGAVDEIAGAPNAETIEECFLRHVKDDEMPHDAQGKNLFHVFVRDESKFREILQVFTALDAHSVVVVEGQAPSVYLGKMPLFADLWADDTSQFCRIIMAALNKKLSNEAIRRIEHVAGQLSESREVLVTVQEVAYAAGALDL